MLGFSVLFCGSRIQITALDTVCHAGAKNTISAEVFVVFSSATLNTSHDVRFIQTVFIIINLTMRLIFSLVYRGHRILSLQLSNTVTCMAVPVIVQQQFFFSLLINFSSFRPQSAAWSNSCWEPVLPKANFCF